MFLDVDRAALAKLQEAIIRGRLFVLG